MKTLVTAGAFDTKGADYGFLVSRIRSRVQQLLTCPNALDEDQARGMARARADLLVAHAGLTTKGPIGARNAMTLEEAAAFVQHLVEAGKDERGDLLVLRRGGHIAEAEVVGWVIGHASSLDGLFGASSNERLASDGTITQRTRRFKSLRHAQEPVSPGNRDGGGRIDVNPGQIFESIAALLFTRQTTAVAQRRVTSDLSGR